MAFVSGLLLGLMIGALGAYVLIGILSGWMITSERLDG